MGARRRISPALLGALALLGTVAVPAAAQDLPVAVTEPDPEFAKLLDQVVAQSPPDTCLRVSVDGVAIYDHRGSDLQTPASTQKLLTASALLSRFDPETRLQTRLVSTVPAAGGVIAGDVTLVGGGDPVLTTSIYRTYQRQPDAQPTTNLDALVDQLAGAGITEIRGRLFVDDGRHDALRTVPSWPSRFLDQDQVGPLGALVIDDGFQLLPKPPPETGVERTRAGDPALAAGDALVGLFASRGITVLVPGVERRPAPAAPTVLASVDSPSMQVMVADLLQRSDNHMAEILLKELGLAASGAGTTAAGAQAVAAWTAEAKAASPGAVVVDGSGLDPGNASSCQGLVAALDANGPESALALGLPVAGRTGTLAGRFGDTAAAGRMRAKTGSLRDVSALAGFVDLPEGGVATFAYVANGAITDQTRSAEALLAQLLATWRPPCPDGSAPPLAAPQVAPMVALAAVPGGLLAGATPGLVTSLVALEDPATAPLDRCSREAGVPVELGVG